MKGGRLELNFFYFFLFLFFLLFLFSILEIYPFPENSRESFRTGEEQYNSLLNTKLLMINRRVSLSSKCLILLI